MRLTVQFTITGEPVAAIAIDFLYSLLEEERGRGIWWFDIDTDFDCLTSCSPPIVGFTSAVTRHPAISHDIVMSPKSAGN